MYQKSFQSQPFSFRCVVLFLLTISFSGFVFAQQSSEKLIIGGESFGVGMAQQEAMKKLDKCCVVSGGKDPRDTAVQAFFIMNKSRNDILGGIWFRDNKVERLERDGEFSDDPNAVNFLTSLYRLLLQDSPSKTSTIILQTGTLEASNASSKVVTFIFKDGRSVELQIVAPDDPQKPRQVSLKEAWDKQ
ncbi:MAG: hypothetical protein WCC87_25660 [Candidatus Korobacteraceae bacterium]